MGYYDPRDVFSTVPRSSVLSTSYEMHARMPGVPNALAGVRLGVIRESMVYPKGSKTEQPIVDAATKEIKDVLGGRLGATLVESSDPLWQRDPDSGADEGRLPRRAGAAGAGVHAGPAVPAAARRHAAVQGVRRGDHADRVPAGQGVWIRNDVADRLLRGAGGGPHRAAGQSRSRHDPAAGTVQHVPLPHLAISVAPRRRLEGQGLHRSRWPTGLRSTRAPSSGATTSAPHSRTGRRSPTRAIRSAGARASTSASCCASCCGART